MLPLRTSRMAAAHIRPEANLCGGPGTALDRRVVEAGAGHDRAFERLNHLVEPDLSGRHGQLMAAVRTAR